MGKLRLGGTEIKKAWLGSTAIKKIYLGTTQIWQSLIPGGSYTFPNTLNLTSTFQAVPLTPGADSAPCDASGVIILPAGSYSAQMSFTTATNWRSDFRAGWRTSAGDVLGATQPGSTGVFSNTFTFTLSADGPVSLLLRSSPNRTVTSSFNLVCTITKV